MACTGEPYPYLEAAGNSAIYIGHLDGNHEQEAGHDVVKKAWTIAYEDQKKRHASELDMLNKTPVERQATAIADIWRHVKPAGFGPVRGTRCPHPRALGRARPW